MKLGDIHLLVFKRSPLFTNGRRLVEFSCYKFALKLTTLLYLRVLSHERHAYSSTRRSVQNNSTHITEETWSSSIPDTIITMSPPAAGRYNQSTHYRIAGENENTPPSIAGLDARDTTHDKVNYIRDHIDKLDRELEVERLTYAQAMSDNMEEQMKIVRKGASRTEDDRKEDDKLTESFAELYGKAMACQLRQEQLRAHLETLNTYYSDRSRHSFLEAVIMPEIVEDIKQG